MTLTLRLQEAWQLLDCGIGLIRQHLVWVVCAPTLEAVLFLTLGSMSHAPGRGLCTMNIDELCSFPGRVGLEL